MRYHQNLVGEADMIKAEIDRLKILETQRRNAATKLWETTQKCLDFADINEITTPLGKLAFNKTPAKLVEIGLVPDRFMVVVPATTRVDKNAVKAAIKAGDKDTNCELVSGRKLVIK